MPAVAVGLLTTWMPLTTAVTGLSWAGAALTGLALAAAHRFSSPARRRRAEARPPAASGVDHQILQGR
ncbi:hypothetical protein ACH4TX_24505 [Streptomyces sp. NPDC021098]|uniref:hypothetical protein n=1 Tax=unclassified Streptomyces TaxID=2593676 RepID=UPI0037A4E384